MKRIPCLLLASALAACSSNNDRKTNPTRADTAAPPVTVADAAVADSGDARGSSINVDATMLSTGADATGADTGVAEFRCPAVVPGLNSECSSEGARCDYSAPLSCPVGCFGGDFHGYKCSQGRWVDDRHTAGAPRCQCQPLNFPSGLQGTWRFNESSLPKQYAWIRFSALGDTLEDAGAPGEGTVEILAGPDNVMASVPWWVCKGQGRWFITSIPDVLEVRPPSTCVSTTNSEIYTVTSRQSEVPISLPRCLLHITMTSSSGAKMEACKYPDTQCNDAMTTCQSQ